MNTKHKITKFSDGGHGWYAVKRSLLHEVGAIPHITACSYQRGETVYLEEDCDASKFFRLFMAQRGLDYVSYVQLDNYFEFKQSYKQVSPIRSYARFCTKTIRPKDLKQGQYVKVNGNFYFVDVPYDGKKVIVKTPMGQRYRLSGVYLDMILPGDVEA